MNNLKRRRGLRVAQGGYHVVTANRGREVRAFVDALGSLNQDVAQVCRHVTLMAAGLPLQLK